MDGLKCIMYEGAFSSTVGSDDLESEKFGEYVAKFHETVFRVAFGYTKNHADAQDIEQDVFLKLYRCGRNFESDEHIRAWLIRVTMNTARNFLRSCSVRRYEPLDEQIPCESESDGALLELVRGLKPEYLTAVYLHYYEGYSVKEIARICRTTPAAVTMRLSRARERLKKIIEEEQ